MGPDAPSLEACRRTLQRLTEDEDDDVSRRIVSGGGKPRTLSDVDDLYIGLVICEGHSQRGHPSGLNASQCSSPLTSP